MNKIFRFVKDKSPTILSILAIGGVFSTGYLTIKATTKAVKKTDEMKEPVTVYFDNVPQTVAFKPPTKKDIIKATWKYYIPSAGSALATVGCILGANILNKRKQAMLTSAYAMINSQYKNYSTELKRLFGNEVHEQILQNMTIENAKDVDIYATGFLSNSTMGFEGDNEEHLFYDAMSKRYFKSTFSKVLLAEYHLNRNYCLGGAIEENQFYEFLGLDPEEIGDDIGWDMGSGIYWIDFEHVLNRADDGTLEYYIINPVFWPEPFPTED